MVAPERRLWDSNILIRYLIGDPEIGEACRGIIAAAHRGDIEIVVSALATVEVARLENESADASELIITELFSRPYVTVAALDAPVATAARGLIRKYSSSPKLRPADAIHLATAVSLGIPVLESMDHDLLRLNGFEGHPAVTIRQPLFLGRYEFPDTEPS